MNKQLLVFTLLLSIQSFSQEYIPMLQEGNTWSVDIYHDIFDCQQEPCVFTITHQINVGEINTINNLDYRRIITDDNPTCLLREEAGIIYKYNEDDNIENVLFDFTLEVGDTFNLDESAYGTWDGCVTWFTVYYDPMITVESVVYIMFAGQQRKVISFIETNGPNGQGAFQWIEGIGNITGFDLLAEFVDITSGSALVCFSTNGVSYFFNGATSCDNTTVLDISSLFSNSTILFPNPVSEIATLTIPQEIPSASIAVFGVNGKKLYEKNISEEHTSLDFSAFPGGMYFYQIYSNNELILTKKLLVR